MRSSANVLNKRACLAMRKVKQGQRENRLQGFNSVSAPCASNDNWEASENLVLFLRLEWIAQNLEFS